MLSIMRFRSCFLLSNFLVFGFPLAVQKEGNLDASHKPDEALNVRDGVDASKDFAATTSMSWSSDGRNIFDQPLSDEAQSLSTNIQSPSKDFTGRPDSVPSTGSFLLADGITDEVPGLSGVGAAAAVGAAGTLDLLGGRIHDVNLLLDDNPTNVKVINPLIRAKKDPGVKEGGGAQAGTITKQSGSGTGAAADGGAIDMSNLCPYERFAFRTLAWCDLGDPTSVLLRIGFGIVVHGYNCTLLPH